MRVDMADFDYHTRFVKYSSFNVEDEASKYRVTLSGLSGNVGKIFLEFNEFSIICSNNQFRFHAEGFGFFFKHSNHNDVSFISENINLQRIGRITAGLTF